MGVILEIKVGPMAGQLIRLKSGESVTIGRSAGRAQFALAHDKLMSGVHFALDYDEKGCRLRDLNSSNGTFLKGARVKEAALANGDEIRAGNTAFVVRVLRDESLADPPRRPDQKPEPKLEPKLEPKPAPSPFLPGGLPSFPARAPEFELPSITTQQPGPNLPPPAPRQPGLQDLLAKDFQPLFALLDASREPSVLKVIYESKEEYQSLYEGAQGAQLAHFAPYLVRVPAKSSLLDTLLKQAWSKSWGIFVTCDTPFKDLRAHFRHFLYVKLPDGTQVYFRYYDPRVLRLFLPTCLPEETNQFFGPVKHFLMEDEDPATVLHFTRGNKGAAKKEFRVVPA